MTVDTSGGRAMKAWQVYSDDGSSTIILAETQYKFLCRVADGLKKLDSIRSINRGV